MARVVDLAHRLVHAKSHAKGLGGPAERAVALLEVGPAVAVGAGAVGAAVARPARVLLEVRGGVPFAQELLGVVAVLALGGHDARVDHRGAVHAVAVDLGHVVAVHAAHAKAAGAVHVGVGEAGPQAARVAVGQAALLGVLVVVGQHEVMAGLVVLGLGHVAHGAGLVAVHAGVLLPVIGVQAGAQSLLGHAAARQVLGREARRGVVEARLVDVRHVGVALPAHGYAGVGGRIGEHALHGLGCVLSLGVAAVAERAAQLAVGRRRVGLAYQVVGRVQSLGARGLELLDVEVALRHTSRSPPAWPRRRPRGRPPARRCARPRFRASPRRLRPRPRSR